MQQNRIQDYIIFAILPRLQQDYTGITQEYIRIFVIQELAVIF